jgi:predicted ATPase
MLTVINMNNGNNKGSIWRIWDLHVHPVSTAGDDYSRFIANASKCKADVIGINDYCSIKGYEEIVKLGGIPNKVIFPVVEFRMHNLLTTKKNPNGVRINFHIIFDNDKNIFPKISTWIASLKCFNEKGENIQLGTSTDLSKVSFDFEKVVDSLKEFNLYDSHSIVWLPYDEYGGIDEIDPVTDALFKLALVNKSHIIGSSTKKQIDFFKWEDEKHNVEQYEKWFDKPKPCIKGSDAHKIDYPFGHLMDSQSEPTDRHCWINADTTFKGLKQIIIEPDRVFIGDEPDLLKRIRANQTKFIKSISIRKVAGATVDDVWFDNFHIELNSALVAIIGNKGGGKSAITDIVGLCGNTHQDPINFSFLNNTKFRKVKPLNLSERFEATLTWMDGTSITKRLNENPDKVLAERVKYIPQNFLERLCANVESDEFEKELKQIIYSHTPNDKRLGKSSLDELINYKSSLINAEISQIQNEVSRLNLVIIGLEQKATADFKKTIQNQLEIKQGELAAHSTIIPQKPEFGNESEESKKLVEKLTAMRENIRILETEIAELKQKKSSLSIKKEELNRSLQYYKNLDEQLKKSQEEGNEFVQILKRNSISTDEVFAFKIDTTKISDVIVRISNEIKDIDILLDSDKPESKTSKLKTLNEELKLGQEVLDKPAKDQQKYLDDYKNWEVKKAEMEGDGETEGTLKFYESQLAYLNEGLISELALRYSERKDRVTELYSKKVLLVEIRRELFQPVTQFINDFKELKKRYDVKLDVAFELRSFAENFFSFVNQARVGTFCGKEEGYKKLLDIIERTSFNSSEAFTQFADELIDNLKHDKRSSENAEVDINTQLRKGIELNQLYDYVFNFDFLQPVYNLKLGNKTLAELSPGERGALLLIFYLILDKDDIPLIIDQPEENLDNESVYHILVHFIKKVKEKRQIIIVTHNPNLAIVCDADQIVNMQIEKENKNTVKYVSGAIEDEAMNKAIVNILEGTLPAFNNRDSKYIRP